MVMGAALSRGFVKALFKPIKTKPTPVSTISNVNAPHTAIPTQPKIDQRPVTKRAEHREQSSRPRRPDAIYSIENKEYYLKEIKFCSRILINDSNNPATYIRRGNAYLALTECDKARKDFYTAIDIINGIDEHGQREGKRYFFSNSETEIINTARTKRFDSYIEIQ